jgi:hypothetical protein
MLNDRKAVRCESSVRPDSCSTAAPELVVTHCSSPIDVPKEDAIGLSQRDDRAGQRGVHRNDHVSGRHAADDPRKMIAQHRMVGRADQGV